MPTWYSFSILQLQETNSMPFKPRDEYHPSHTRIFSTRTTPELKELSLDNLENKLQLPRKREIGQSSKTFAIIQLQLRLLVFPNKLHDMVGSQDLLFLIETHARPM
jgi:hypothetical protein